MSDWIVLAVADDHLMLDRLIERICAGWRDAQPGLVMEVFEGDELDHLPEMRTATLFGGPPAVVIRRAHRLSAAVRRELLDYLQAPEPDVPLLLAVEGGRGGPADLKQAVEAAGGEVATSAVPADWDERGWMSLIRDEFKRLGRHADDGAVAAIRYHAGSSAATIASHVSQVVAASADGQVTAGDVDAVVVGTGERSPNAVVNAFEGRDASGALVAARGALDAGVEPTWIATALIRRVEDLLEIRGGGRPPRMSPGQAGRLKGVAVRSFKPGELAWCHDRLARLDLDLRGSDLPAHVLVEAAVIDLCT